MIGKNLSKLIPEFSPLLDKLSENITEHQININRSEITQILRTRVSVQKIEGRIIGYVVTFDDITDFLLAQKKAAWSDVARRIAHEIKNPLTPIELATNRLKKKYCPKNTEKAKDFICENGYDKKNGARPLNRAIQKFVENLIAEEIVNSKIKEGDQLNIDHYKNDGFLTLPSKKSKKKTD